MSKISKFIIWISIALLGSFAFSIIAISQNEQINATWIIIASICSYLIAYRFYSLFIANKILKLDNNRITPAFGKNDGLNYVPTNKYILFGHHFAAIAGAGPLIGPVLAAQMGYIPGMLWILIGVIFAGAVQDFIILFISVRRGGRSIGDLVKMELGIIPGVITLFGAFLIMIIILAVLALIVIKALTNSPWGTFTVISTIPIAIFMGIYLQYIKPGKIGEISLIGILLLISSIVVGRYVNDSVILSQYFTFNGTQLTFLLIIYGCISSMLPVWMLLAPRDYLATFLKIGTIIALAIGIIIVSPELKMPGVTKFINGNGPVWSGNLFPFLFITIACGAVSGFHALISSGTTPKLLDKEINARFIGYGAMLMESFVAIMALIAASIIDPGIYFAMNSPSSLIGVTPEIVANTISSWGYIISSDFLTSTAKAVGENTIISRIGGAPTLAIGMAQILHQIIGGKTMMAFWYHFAILFEALFILTAVDSGTRAGRFMLQDLLGLFWPSIRKNNSILITLVTTVICVSSWGYFLYQGVIDPLGGINTLWPLFGISNQMLAAIALILGTVVLFKMKQNRYALITLMPTIWILICTITAAFQKIFHSDPKIGFLSHASIIKSAINNKVLIHPAKSFIQMNKIILNDYINTLLAGVFLLIITSIIIYGIRSVRIAKKSDIETVNEIIYKKIS